MNTLSFIPAERPFEKLRGGAYRTGHRYQEMLIDGVALGPKMRRIQDLISCLGWGTTAGQRGILASLLLEAPEDFPGGRRALYVCAECGGLECGAVTAVIERVGDTVRWRDFRYEWEIDQPIDAEWLRDLGPFEFRWDDYEHALRAAVPLAPVVAPDRKSWWRRLWF